MFFFPLISALLVAALVTAWYSKKRARKVHDLNWRLLGLSDLCGRRDADALFEDVCEACLIYRIEPAELGYQDYSELRSEAIASMRLRRKRLALTYRKAYARFKELMTAQHWSPDESKEFRSLRETVMRNGAELNAFHRRIYRFVRSS
jgi:hypothetical protein